MKQQWDFETHPIAEKDAYMSNPPEKNQATSKKRNSSELASNQQLPPPVKNDSDKKSIIMELLKFVAVPILVALIGAGAFIGIKQNNNNPPVPTSPTILPSVQTPLIATSKLVQNERASSSATPNVVAFHQPVTRGDFLIVAVTQFERQVLPLKSGVTDNQNDGYHLIASAIATPDQQQDYVELYYAPGAIGGSTKVTVTFSKPADLDGGDTNVSIYEFSGMSRVESFKPNNGLSNSSPIAFSAGALSTTGNYDMCFAVGVDSGPFDQSTTDDNTISVGTGYEFPPTDWKGQLDRQENWNGGERFYTEYDPAIAPGGCNPNFTIHYAATWAIVSAAFRL